MIRRATQEDMSQMLVIGEKFCAAAGQPLNREALERSLTVLLQSDNAAIFVNEDVSGIIAGLLFPSFFSGELIAQELFWWAQSEGLSLLKHFEEWAQAAGASQVIMLCLDSIEPERVAKIYQRRGYSALEHSFTRACTWQ
jgi:hypothetical protein